jgi:hypothetical protein
MNIAERTQKIWEAFCGELTQEPTDDMREALVTALRTIPDNMNGYPGILYKYADELEKLEPETLKEQ